jgi:hypothetical protein
MPEKEMLSILSHEQNQNVFPLCQILNRLDKNAQATFVSLLREVWTEFRKQKTGIFETLARFPHPTEFDHRVSNSKLEKHLVRRYAVSGDDVVVRTNIEDPAVLGHLDVDLGGEVRDNVFSELLDDFYLDLFTYPLRNSNMEFKELLLNNSQLKQIAQGILQEHKSRLLARVTHVEQLGAQLNPTQKSSPFEEERKHKPRSFSMIVAEVLKPPANAP